jgi:hypothetical protein
MLKLPLLLIAIVTLAIAGCGGGGGGGEASSPLDEALRYLPADTPFAAVIETDTKGEQYRAAGEIADRFGLGDKLVEQIEESLDADEGEIARIEKALGNEFVVGSTSVRAFIQESGSEDESFVGAIQASDRAALDRLIQDEEAKEVGESNGATIYKDDDSDEFAVEDDVLVVAGNRKELDSALATRDGDDSLTEEDFDAGTEGVPTDALARVYLNVEQLLSVDPDAKQALKSKWVDALTTGGIALTVRDDEIAIDFNLKTDGEELTEEDLPIAAGAESPEVLDRGGEISVALREPAQVLAFVERTMRQVDPESFSSFDAGRTQLERRLKIDLEEDLLGQLEDGLSVSVSFDGKFGARGELADPRAFEATLEKLAGVLPDIAEGIAGQKVGFAKPKAGEDFYAVATADGDQVVFGVVDGVFVLSNDAGVAGTLAAEDTVTVPGAEGALVLRTDAEELARTLIQGFGDAAPGILGRVKNAIGVRPLDELTGSIEASPEALSGRFELTLD